LKHVETENSKLRNTNIILKGELSSCEEENYKLEKTINSLKEQLEYYEKLKAELDHTKGELLLTTKRLKKFEKSTEKLDEILSSQRSPNDKTGLGYNDILKTKKQEKEVENDETNTPERVEQQDRKIEFKRNETSRRSSPIRYERNNYEGNYRRIDREPRWTTPQRRSLTPRYQNFFLGHCYTCGNFGHKAINCRINERNNYASYMNGVNRRYGNNRGFVNRSYNSFYPLMDKNIVCYK
jgi:chromosome segregation ATPase